MTTTRERHRPFTNALGEPIECGYCAEDRWPCDAIREADRADKAEAALAEMTERCGKAQEEWVDAHTERDAARADAERLAEALDRETDDRLHVDERTIAALTAHEEAVK